MLLALLLACPSAQDKGEDSAIDCASAPNVTWEGWGEGFFLTWCQACHGSASTNRNGAPADQVFDTWEDVVAREPEIRETVLVEGSMPLGGGVYEDELYQLDVLLSCAE